MCLAGLQCCTALLLHQIGDIPCFEDNFPNFKSAANEQCILQVPSAVTKGDFNLLINPKHPEFGNSKVMEKAKFPFVERIFR